jgi:hypothetical protein
MTTTLESRYFMFGKYNGFVSKARVSACMYFLVYFVAINDDRKYDIHHACRNLYSPGHRVPQRVIIKKLEYICKAHDFRAASLI